MSSTDDEVTLGDVLVDVVVGVVFAALAGWLAGGKTLGGYLTGAVALVFSALAICHALYMTERLTRQRQR